MFQTKATTSLDANWHWLIAIPHEPVDLLAQYPSATIVADGTIDLVDPNPFVILRNALYDHVTETWSYRTIGIDVPIPELCQPLAWRPTHIRREVALRLNDIERMIEFLAHVGHLKEPARILAAKLERTLGQDRGFRVPVDMVTDVIKRVY